MTFKVADAMGVAVYEMPAMGAVEDAAVIALAAEAMQAAAATVTGRVSIGELTPQFHECGAAGTLRAEAIVMRLGGGAVRLAADVLSGGRRVASFETDAAVVA